MSRLHDRFDVHAEIGACERIWALDDTSLNLELISAGLDPETLLQRAGPGDATAGQEGDDAENRHLAPPASRTTPLRAPLPAGGTAIRTQEIPPAPAVTLGEFEAAGRVKFFNALRGFGMIVTDGGLGDALVHILHLQRAGYTTIHEGTRVHALVHRTVKGLQVSRIISIDESSAVHPSQLPQRTHVQVQPESDWVPAVTKWYNLDKGYGFVCTGTGPDYLVHACTLQRWGVAPLRPKQLVEIRWGMTPKGRMVAEIRYPGGAVALPPVH